MSGYMIALMIYRQFTYSLTFKNHGRSAPERISTPVIIMPVEKASRSPMLILNS
jgi:hypothetical protein